MCFVTWVQNCLGWDCRNLRRTRCNDESTGFSADILSHEAIKPLSPTTCFSHSLISCSCHSGLVPSTATLKSWSTSVLQDPCKDAKTTDGQESKASCCPHVLLVHYCCHTPVKTWEPYWQAWRRARLSTVQTLSYWGQRSCFGRFFCFFCSSRKLRAFPGAPYIQKTEKLDWTCLEVRQAGDSMEACNTQQSTEMSSSHSERMHVQHWDCHAMLNDIRYQHSMFRLVGSDHEERRARDSSWQAELTW